MTLPRYALRIVVAALTCALGVTLYLLASGVLTGVADLPPIDEATMESEDVAVIDVPQYCSVHGKVLRREQVPIRYGLLKHVPGYDEARQRHFPNAHLFVAGGCLVRDVVQSDEQVCTACRTAELSWQQQHTAAHR